MSELNEEFYEDDDEWEDRHTYKYILGTLPAGWSLVRVMGGWQVLSEMRDWLQENTTGGYREVNWGGECSYSVGVMLEKQIDIVLFKLRWGY